MIPRRIADATHRFGAPAGWQTERDGNCSALMVRMTQDKDGGPVIFESAWEPTPEELALLNAGGSIVLRVLGSQPPVALYTTVQQEHERAA